MTDEEIQKFKARARRLKVPDWFWAPPRKPKLRLVCTNDKPPTGDGQPS